MLQVEIKDDFDLQKTATSGQCFRAKRMDDGFYRFVSGEHVIYIKNTDKNNYSVSCSAAEWDQIWSYYFDLERSYREIYDREKEKHEFVRKAMECGRGLRILRQDPWEMLISFIISQRKSIPAITGSVEALAKRFGHPIETEYGTVSSFPTVEEMLNASESDLRECGLGYRVPYVSDAVRRVSDGSLDLKALESRSDEELFLELQKVYGVGKKVANCVCLFGYGRMSRVPVDVWIARAVEEDCRGEDPFVLFHGDAGIIQQYVFYYMKNRK